MINVGVQGVMLNEHHHCFVVSIFFLDWRMIKEASMHSTPGTWCWKRYVMPLFAFAVTETKWTAVHTIFPDCVLLYVPDFS